MAFSEDGRNWMPLNTPVPIRVPLPGKVGVVAESTAEGKFKVVFDEFKLTPIKAAK